MPLLKHGQFGIDPWRHLDDETPAAPGQAVTVTLARWLRERLHYAGELRAAGNVLRDQLLFMQRCGIDAYEVPDRAIAENWLAAFQEIDVFYQPAEDHRPSILRQRLLAAHRPTRADAAE